MADSQQQTQDAPVAEKIKLLPVVGAIVASVDEEKDQVPNKYPDPMPSIKMKMRYKPMPELTQADRFLYFIPRVYKDALNFNWEDRDC